MSTAPLLPAIAALTFSADRAAETHLQAVATGRRRGVPIGPPAEVFKARRRVEAGRIPTHRKDLGS